jgi:hypothetical protein
MRRPSIIVLNGTTAVDFGRSLGSDGVCAFCTRFAHLERRVQMNIVLNRLQSTFFGVDELCGDRIPPRGTFQRFICPS